MIGFERDGARARCVASVAADSPCFAGHFDGYPVLAGVAQLDGVVLELVERAFPELGPLERCSRIKFRRVIGPGDELEVVAICDRQTVQFEISRDGETCSSGTLHFGSRQ